jgi:two-component system KDP operon response regulator KdpE
MTRPARILLVDDETSIQRGLSPLLASRGYEVESATTGHAALQAFEQVPADLVVLDLGLPDLEGSEVCRRLRVSSQVPIIVLSARGSDVDKIAALDQGADDWPLRCRGRENGVAVSTSAAAKARKAPFNGFVFRVFVAIEQGRKLQALNVRHPPEYPLCLNDLKL